MVVAVLAAWLAVASHAQQKPVRRADEDVKSPELREKPGLSPNENMLFNGWGVTPAGEHVPISDMALKLAVSPDKKMLLAACGGFSNTGLILLDMAGKRVTQFLPLAEAWNGLAFSRDGSRIFVSGGDSGHIYVFNYADGKVTGTNAVQPAAEATGVFLAGIAVHPTTGKVYVCNEGNHEVWVLHRTLLHWKPRSKWGCIRTRASLAPTSAISTSATGAAARSARWTWRRIAVCGT